MPFSVDEVNEVSEEEVGRVQSFFRKPSVAAMVLTGDLSIGDNIRIRGATTDIEMTVESMQINLESVESARIYTRLDEATEQALRDDKIKALA